MTKEWLQEVESQIEGMDVGNYYGADMLASALTEMTGNARDLLEEVRELKARLAAVENIVLNAAAYGDDIPALRILQAARGSRS